MHSLALQWLFQLSDSICADVFATEATRVARWYIFKSKIKIWVDFGGSCNGSCLYIIWPFGLLWQFYIFCGHLVHYIVLWYIFPRFGVLHQDKSGNPGGQCGAIYWTNVFNVATFLVSGRGQCYDQYYFRRCLKLFGEKNCRASL
jgi:hypothetical protein